MVESGGRRIKRHITINTNSIKPCKPELITRLLQLSLLKNRLDQYMLDKQNYHIDPDVVSLLTSDKRCLSNLTLYRLYVEAYLSKHPGLNSNMTFIIRELQNVNYGIPVEIYVFASTTDWVKYEAIQASVFDYLYLILPLFELEAYQYESETLTGFETGAA
tara:strand:- start:1119 stop:1601 length:483 start_codon:yes stop_codon:yes gene_type:complete